MINGLAYGGAGVLASSLDMRVGCEHASFRFLAAAYGRINSTWTLPNQVGWPIAKELLFSGRVVEAEEAHRIGLLNHLVPCAQLRDKTMWLATMIAKNRREAVMGVKALLLEDLGRDLRRAVDERTRATRPTSCGAPGPSRPFRSSSPARAARCREGARVSVKTPGALHWPGRPRLMALAPIPRQRSTT